MPTYDEPIPSRFETLIKRLAVLEQGNGRFKKQFEDILDNLHHNLLDLAHDWALPEDEVELARRVIAASRSDEPSTNNDPPGEYSLEDLADGIDRMAARLGNSYWMVMVLKSLLLVAEQERQRRHYNVWLLQLQAVESELKPLARIIQQNRDLRNHMLELEGREPEKEQYSNQELVIKLVPNPAGLKLLLQILVQDNDWLREQVARKERENGQRMGYPEEQNGKCYT